MMEKCKLFTFSRIGSQHFLLSALKLSVSHVNQVRIHPLVMNYSHDSVLIQLPVQCNSCFTLYLVYFRCIYFFFTLLALCGRQRKNTFLYRAYDNKHFDSSILRSTLQRLSGKVRLWPFGTGHKTKR